MIKIIEYFSKNHILTNFIVIAVFIGAVIFWNKTGKEEMPNVTFDFVRITASYPGATSEEVEYYITKEIEEALEGIDGIDNIQSSSSQGSCSISIELEPNNPNRKNVVDEIKDAVDSVKLPSDVENDPVVREYKSTKRPIINLMLSYRDTDRMTREQRLYIQSVADTLEDKLIALSSVSEVNISGYLNDFIEIQVIPDKLKYYNISFTDIITAIKKNNVKQPVGNLDDQNSTRIRLDTELVNIEDIKNVIVQSGFEGNKLLLKNVANVVQKFEDQRQIQKVNGFESVRINITKTSSTGILEAVDQIKKMVNDYKNTSLKNSPVELNFMEDDSESVRSRLSLIASNGLFGFILVILVLFIFLDAKSGFWIAMGIPFSFGFTMIFASLLGHTINNMTLAAVIIVMGMVVDDAIVIAENISRLRAEGLPLNEAVVKGAATVFLPVFASITTTCAAFIPLFYFQGFFGMMTKYIPPIIFLMLGGSLFEALLILPSHLGYKYSKWLHNISSLGILPFIEKYYKKNKEKKLNHETENEKKIHWFMKVEDAYGRLLRRLLKYRKFLYIAFIILLIYTGWLFITKMKYVMFPREETTEVIITGEAPLGTLKDDTEKMIRPIENIFKPYMGKEVVGFETSIARGRRGSEARENVFSINIEVVPKDKRKKSVNKLIEEWQKEIDKISGFNYINFAKSRFGHSSGSPIDIIIKENDNEKRDAVAGEILKKLELMPSLYNPEIEVPLSDPEYKIQINRELTSRLGISAETLALTLRTILQGNNVYDISKSDKDTEVIVTVPSKSKIDIESLLNLPIENSSRYLVPLKNISIVNKTISPNSINRLDGKRVLHVYADLAESIKNKSANNNMNNNNKKPNDDIKKIVEQAKKGDKEAQKKLMELKEKLKSTPDNKLNENNKQNKIRTNNSEQIKKLKLPVNMTPLEIAEYLEQNVFPQILNKYPTTELSFGGEIKNTRESTGDFIFAVILVIILIYLILALSLNSLIKPFIIIISIPFGCAGIILTLQFHGMLIYGFFSVVGALGLAGVVVNDSIVLLTKLEEEYKNNKNGNTPIEKVANITKTRLRAVMLTTITTVAGLLPTAYGIFGYDSMLAEMMLTLSWGLIFGTLITLLYVPSLYCTLKEISIKIKRRVK